METKFALVQIESLENIQNDLEEIKLLLQKTKNSEKTKKIESWISQKEAMELLGVKETTLYKLRKSQKLRSTITRPIFYCLKSIEEYLENSSK